MATAWKPLANFTLGSAAATVTFSSISGSYRDLVLVMNYGMSSTYSAVSVQFNADTGTNYHFVSMFGDGSSPGSTANTAIANAKLFNYGNPGTALTLGIVANFLDYSATDKHKTILTRSSDQYSTEASTSRWASTAAITSIKLFPSAGNFISGSTFALYGVSA